MDGVGNWTISLALFSQGTTPINFYATDQNGTSSPRSVSLSIDTVAPGIDTIAVPDCLYSLRASACLLPSVSSTLAWTSSSTDISFFNIFQNNVSIGTTTALSLATTLSAGVNTFFIVTEDVVGNRATSSDYTIEMNSSPIIINEIAWSGTATSSADEWIELYNKTAYTLDLSRVVLRAEDGAPYIFLSGTIAPNGYYLIERTNDNTISDITADLAVPFSGIGNSFGLLNGGEVLYIEHLSSATTTLDMTPALSSCGGSWCAGTDGTRQSMERVNASAPGATTTNWMSNNILVKNGHDFGGLVINGTPKELNSASQLKQIGYYCAPYTSTYIEGGVYTHIGTICHYLSLGVSGLTRYGDIYKGTVGSSTIVTGHQLGNPIDSLQNGDTLSSPQTGERFFVAIFQIRSGPNFEFGQDLNGFRNYFQTGSIPPHPNFGILNFIYGP